MKKSAIIGMVIVIILIAGGGAFYLTRGASSGAPSTTTSIPATAAGHSSTTIPSSGTVGNPSSGSGNYTLKIASLAGIGQYLVNASGWSLYMYTPDVQYSNKSTCYGGCAVAWPPFYTANVTAQPGVNAAWVTNVNRVDGTKELAYNGLPLYYWQGDKAPGQITGQGVGGVWYLVSPAGTIIKNATT